MEKVHSKEVTPMLDDEYEDLALKYANLMKEYEETRMALREAQDWQDWQRFKNREILGQEEAVHINQQLLSVSQQLVDENRLQSWSYEAPSILPSSMPIHEFQEEFDPVLPYSMEDKGISLTFPSQTSMENGALSERNDDIMDNTSLPLELRCEDHDEFGGEKRDDLVESTPHEEVVEMSIGRLEEFKKLDVNSSLVELLRTMPNYEKFLEDVDKRKMRMDDDMTIELSKGCSAKLQGKFPIKESNHGDFTIPCEIGGQMLKNVLCDMGSRVNVMPLPIFEHLKIGTLMPTMTIFRMADRSITIPWGKIENVLIKVGKFIFPVDFFVLDIEEEHNIPLILGMPFLSTSRALMDVCDGSLTFRVDEEEVTFHKPKLESELPTPREEVQVPSPKRGDLRMNEVKFKGKIVDPFHENCRRVQCLGKKASFDVP